MTASKYEKYICTELTPELKERDAKATGYDRQMQHVIYLDSGVIPGAMYADCVWFNPGYLDAPEVMRQQEGLGAHTHDFDEVIGFFGTDLDDPYNLDGEVELWLEDEKHVFTSSFMAFIPAGMKHCPMNVISMNRRMFHFTLGTGKEYGKTESQPAGAKSGKQDTSQYIVTGLKDEILKAPWSAGPKQAGNGHGGRQFYLDSEIVPGAFYAETVWVTPLEEGSAETVFPGGDPVETHSHDFDEIIGFFGTNPDDVYDLGGEVELWIEDEKQVITRSCMVYLPAGTQHCPLRFHRVDRPMFYFTAGPGGMYF